MGDFLTEEYMWPGLIVLWLLVCFIFFLGLLCSSIFQLGRDEPQPVARIPILHNHNPQQIVGFVDERGYVRMLRDTWLTESDLQDIFGRVGGPVQVDEEGRVTEFRIAEWSIPPTIMARPPHRNIDRPIIPQPSPVS